MKNTLVAAAVFTLILSACGIETDPAPASTLEPHGTGTVATDGGTTATVTPDAGTTLVTKADVAKVLASRKLGLSAAYVSQGAVTVVGNLPGINWSNGTAVIDSDGDAYYEYTVPANAVGTYDLTYMVAPNGWADYGSKATLQSMSAAGRAFVTCSWYDASAHRCVSGSGCGVKIVVKADGTVDPGGNMGSADLAHDPGCN